MCNPLPDGEAREECIKLMQMMEKHGRLDYDIPISDADPRFALSYLYGPARGQMFGVCVCRHLETNQRAVLKAFSAQYNGSWLVPGWVAPLLDTALYNQEVARADPEIKDLTQQIKELEKKMRTGHDETVSEAEAVSDDETVCAESGIDGAKCAAAAVRAGLAVRLAELKKQRAAASAASWRAIQALYRFTCFDGTVRTLRDAGRCAEDERTSPAAERADIGLGHTVFGAEPAVRAERTSPAGECAAAGSGISVPTGTGDCCAPKLLSYAYANNLKPLSLAEFYYGAPNKSKTRESGNFYQPCDEKCSFILPVLTGLDILYHDEHIAVINKPAGLLSVPGRGENMQDSAANRILHHFENCIAQPSVHRLDMDTSGLMVFALTEQSHRTLSIDFMEGRVFKQYDAVLRGHLPREKTAACVHGPAGDEGIIDLKFRLDPENRPYQVYDPVNGKRGITRWKKVNSRKIERLGMTRILFTPETGRTHQLRLHSAHPDGLGLPIAGDRLYGTRKEGERLMLHACVLEFNHPFDGRTMRFDCPSGF